MLQLTNHLSRGSIELNDVPCPAPSSGSALIRTHRSLISVGTERMLVDFGRANLIEKARQQPDKVRQVFDKVKTDGLVTTLEAVRAKLDEPMAMGYCNVGTIVELGSGVEHLRVGDRVASNGKHAEMIVVPKNLCARVPDRVSDEAAAFTVIGAIALQGVRLAARGIVFGVVAAAGLGKVFSSLLFSVGVLHVLPWMAAIAILVSTVLVASFLPARRAASIEPMQALRTE